MPQIQNAAYDGNLQEVKRLVNDEGTPVNQREGIFGLDRTALHTACEAGHFDVVQYLLTHNDIDINVQDARKKTPLHYACEKNNSDIVQELLNRPEINLELQDVNGLRPGETEITMEIQRMINDKRNQ
eukprot:gb/GECH01012529.1/.p1 GENE.gb/GECH01012529.1/~~gb/GECH01012529.1/.p1  ORF type:complete len:128 (+),score=31.10 gb/GECH01012529.1/:1-384(+)